MPPLTDEETLEAIRDLLTARKRQDITIYEMYRALWDTLKHSEFWNR